MSLATPPDLEALRQALAGRYIVERVLGRGGMGVVYLAREVRLDRPVALKLLPPARAAQAAAREAFLREARTAARLSHPNIIPIYAVDDVGGFVFFAMAYVEGESLGQRIMREGPLGPSQAARLLRQVAGALAYAHARGVVHRDVKPDNIMVDRHTGRAIVTDFGIARVGSERGTTGPNEVVGTAEFMSPEQAAGRGAGPQSDLYSLGVVGYYAVSGCLPFQGVDGMAVLARHLTARVPPLASLAPSVPRRLVQVIERCLAKEPTARFPDGDALAAAVAPLVHGRAEQSLAIRGFLAGSRQLAPVASVYGLLLGVGVLPAVVELLLGPLAAWARAAIAGVAVGLAGLPLAVTLGRVRLLQRAGQEREDLVDALDADLERRREDLAFLYGDTPSRVERFMGALSYLALGAALAITGALHVWPDIASIPGVPGLSAGAAGVAVLGAVIARVRTEHRTDPRAERRLRFWRGPLGRGLFALAGIGLTRPGPARGAVHQGTAAPAIGVVGDRFFEARPPAAAPDGVPLTPPAPA